MDWSGSLRFIHWLRSRSSLNKNFNSLLLLKHFRRTGVVIWERQQKVEVDKYFVLRFPEHRLREVEASPGNEEQAHGTLIITN